MSVADEWQPIELREQLRNSSEPMMRAKGEAAPPRHVLLGARGCGQVERMRYTRHLWCACACAEMMQELIFGSVPPGWCSSCCGCRDRCGCVRVDACAGTG